jgi:hypothetical protein
MGDADRVEVDRLSDGYMGLVPAEPVSRAELVYSVQPLDWVARTLSLVGLAGLASLGVRTDRLVPRIDAGILNRRAWRIGSHATRIGE